MNYTLSSGKRWTKEEDEFLLKRYLAMTYVQIAEKLGRDYESVQRRGYRLGINKRESVPAKGWTLNEIEFLKENYDKFSDKELAEKLGRTYWSVRHKRLQLRLLRPTVHSKAPKARKPESEIETVVEKWLEKNDYEFVRQYKPLKGHVPRLDFYVKPNIIIECKGTNLTVSLPYLLGQLLICDFCYPRHKIYCAIPRDLGRMIKRLEILFNHYNMPFGILLVSGEVQVYRDNYGVFER